MRLSVFAVMCFLASSVVLFAQTPTSLEGVILDPDQKAVANAAIVVRNEATGVIRAVVSDSKGHFTAEVPPGTYSLEVAAGGFVTQQRNGIHVAAGKTENVALTLSVAGLNEQVTVSEALPKAARTAPSQGSLAARSAESVVSDSFIRNYTSPIADYTQVVQMSPGTFSFAPNGVGLGDSKTFYRGFQDGYYNITFDGIPFNDTNTPSHHSWAFFPTQFIGGTVFDRSPGSASTVGPTTYGGSINLLSRDLHAEPLASATASYGSFKTKLIDAEYDSGEFGPDGSSRLIFDAHQMTSDGYQTFNRQKRDASMLKYQYAASEKTQITVFGSYILLHANTPNTKGPTRSQVATFGDDYLLSGNPADPNYYGYNFYRVPTDFDYVGIRSDLGHGWTVDDKVYTYSYYNKQNYNGTTITATSATDKLNSYRKYGNVLPVTHDSATGTFRTGLWSEYAMTNRYQIPADPRTWIDAPVPNFHERFDTTTLQPYAEYEFKITPALRITPGVKYAYYKQDFTQYADNGKTVGSLNGAPSVTHSAAYHAWLPSLDAHYLLATHWSIYGQYGEGQNIPPTSVFDVKNARVAVLPKPTMTTTYQAGTVWKSDRFTLDFDAYRIRFENDYSSSPDPATGEPVYYLAGSAITKGLEAESNIVLGRGFTTYLNGTVGSAKYVNTGMWVQNAPRDTETLGLAYQLANWNVGLFSKRIGKMYDDNGNINQAVAIDPFNITNLFLNYTFKGTSMLGRTTMRLGVNNLFNDHNIVGVNPASTKTSIASPNDILNLQPARSISLTFTFGVSPRSSLFSR